MPARETWATRLGFILAAVGSAVGLGNIWRFPFLTGEAGGAAFLVVYLLFVGVIGLPVLLVEFVIGRRSERNPVNAFERLGKPGWTFAGAIGALAGFIILSYYSVVGGWVLQYVIDSFTGAYFADPEGHFAATATGTNAVLFHALFMGLVAGIVALGIRNGLERAAKLMVPSVIVLLVILAGYGATLSDASEAYAYYLAPDFGEISANLFSIIPDAAGQAFFTLSLGMGVMITYASYLGEDRNLLTDGLTVVVIDTAIAFLAGLVVFPFLFAQNVDPGEGGAGTVFIGLADAFAGIPAGSLVGAVFYIMLAIAALTSAFSILEVIVSFLIDNFGVDRKTGTIAIAAVLFVLGIPTALDLTYLDAYDLLANNILLILGGLLLSLFVGWVYADGALDELNRGRGSDGAFAAFWIWTVRLVVPIVLVVTLALGVSGYIEFLNEAFF
ncbi:sodium-dependent transporter [Halegenticoccus tardaugens]|uniref:sodium-dependent transporter n=1 Tax=Halegenticoccus tardaugens TaxID=2071624 RepID=UPI00100A6952|nr:sodium-dependent transporter [Halegenticoccus tardaugens]